MNLLIPFDTETTDLIEDFKMRSDDYRQPHIVQLAAHMVDFDSRKILQTMNVYVRPENWDITEGAFNTHGISKEFAMDVGVSEKLAVEMFLDIWSGHPRTAYNTTFDNRIIRIAIKRYIGEKMAEQFRDGTQGVEWQCMMIAARKIIGGKQPTLGEAYEYFMGRTLENAHCALHDTNALLELYWAIQDHGKDNAVVAAG